MNDDQMDDLRISTQCHSFCSHAGDDTVRDAHYRVQQMCREHMESDFIHGWSCKN